MIKVIACSIFKNYIEQLDLQFVNYNFTYLEVHQHNQPQKLAKEIQKEIDQTNNVEKIIVLYGLCGNALLSIKTNQIPLILVRVHDCLSILLGSKKRFNELFGDRLSSAWTCLSLKQQNYQIHDNYQKWVELYDIDTADYLKETLSFEPKIYISMGLKDEIIGQDEEVIIGDLSFLKEILLGNSKELINLNTNQKIVLSSNINEVFTCKGEDE